MSEFIIFGRAPNCMNCIDLIPVDKGKKYGRCERWGIITASRYTVCNKHKFDDAIYIKEAIDE